MEKDLIKININKLKAAYENTIKPVKENVPQIISKYKNKVRGDKERRKLQIIEDYYKQVIRFECILNKWMQDLTKISGESYEKK